MHYSTLRFAFFLLLFFAVPSLMAQEQSAIAPSNGNPLIPGYFADPTIRKFGDTFYIYATTDGNGGGHGPSQVWTSKDFVNWTMKDMNWPTSFYYWAPDVIKAKDNKYYMYYCQPVDIYGASSNSPIGPWTPLLPDNKSMIANYFVPGVITLDAQAFRDDDDKMYMFWGTWGTYPDHGCGVGLLNPDMHTFAKTAKIPNTIAKEFFEAPFMFKRKGIYYLTYSSGFCENETYRVQYAVSKTGPMGPFEFGKNNPVLSTNADGTIHGPGHQSVVQVGNDFYLVYHRHNNPHSNGGYHRQVCADKLVFDKDGNIEKLIPTHTGVGALAKISSKANDEAYLKQVTASSYYSKDYLPKYAVDNNNGTVWKSEKNNEEPAWLQIDLGSVTPVKQVETQFEYATWYYQYKIETSLDGEKWDLFADRTKNTQHGSPMVDQGDAKARYVKLTIEHTEYPGLFNAVWNIKVYKNSTVAVPIVSASPAPIIKDEVVSAAAVVDIDAASIQAGAPVNELTNKGSLGGQFNAVGKAPFVDIISGKKAMLFNGTQSLESSFSVPRSLSGNNSYSIYFSVYCEQLRDENPIVSWTSGTTDHTSAVFGYGSNQTWGVAQHFGVSDFPYLKVPQPKKWHDIVITFDGAYEKVYIDGVLDNQENKMLFLQKGEKIVIGTKTNKSLFFSGALSALKIYNYMLSEAAVLSLTKNVKKEGILIYLNASNLNYGPLKQWVNNGEMGEVFEPQGKNMPKVNDVGGKIALSIPASSSLKFAKQIDGSQYQERSIAFSCFLPEGNSKDLSKGKWHFVIKTINAEEERTFVDGVEMAGKELTKYKAVEGLLLVDAAIKQGNSLGGAISQYAVYAHTLSSTEIKELNALWLKNLHAPVSNALGFRVKPKAIAPTMAEMEASSDENLNLQYYFTFNQKDPSIGKWTEDPHFLTAILDPNKIYDLTFKVKDNFGNVSGWAAPVGVNTNPLLFNQMDDSFFTQDLKDKLASGITIENGNLRLTSKGTNWDGKLPQGPFLYKTITGDFVAEVEVTDVSGLTEKVVKGNNEVGLMVRKAPDAENKEALVQNGIFPAWKCGNLATNLRGDWRSQFNTQSAWQYNRFLQIQKSGEHIHLRSSKDGVIWENLPGSPFLRPDLKNADVQVGMYQCTYGPQEGFGRFAGFKLITLKNDR